jgi:hypothetical protein
MTMVRLSAWQQDSSQMLCGTPAEARLLVAILDLRQFLKAARGMRTIEAMARLPAWPGARMLDFDAATLMTGVGAC